MRRQVSLHLVKQCGAGQEVEKIIRVKMTGMMVNTALLMRRGFMGNVHVG